MHWIYCSLALSHPYEQMTTADRIMLAKSLLVRPMSGKQPLVSVYDASRAVMAHKSHWPIRKILSDHFFRYQWLWIHFVDHWSTKMYSISKSLITKETKNISCNFVVIIVPADVLALTLCQDHWVLNHLQVQRWPSWACIILYYTCMWKIKSRIDANTMVFSKGSVYMKSQINFLR